MTSPQWIAIGTALLMAGLLAEALMFRAIHRDMPSLYKLFAVRDKLIRLVVEKKIDRYEPHFDALYRNVTILLQSSRCISGPGGWKLAEMQGKHLAYHPHGGQTLAVIPEQSLPENLSPVVGELREALEHLIGNHFGVIVQVNSHRRELARIQKEQAKALLKMIHTQSNLCSA